MLRRRCLALAAPLLGLLCACSVPAPVVGSDGSGPQPAAERPVRDISADAPAASRETGNAVEATVTHVVDGDTVDVTTSDGDQARVRVIGIDTPERGECNFGPASHLMKELVLDRAVTLHTAGPAKDDSDRYGRWLRYVDVDGTDAGLAEIEAGLAVARYDSRDGYGAHPREAVYVARDAAVQQGGCGGAQEEPPADPEPAAAAATPGVPVNYGGCQTAKDHGAVPPGGYENGVDVEYGFYRDGDGDGFVCE